MFGVLGRTALLIDGVVIDHWGRPRERAILGALLIQAGRWVSVDALIDWAWPAENAQPLNRGPTFHTYAVRIRKWLRQMPVPADLDPGNGGYRLNVDKSQIDYYRFTALLGEARAHAKQRDSQKAVACARRALNLWRGRPLDDLAGEPARAWRQRVVQDDWLGANRTLLAALLDLHDYDEVLTRTGELQADHPNDVTLATQRMSALHGLGRYEDETAFYFAVRNRLRDDGDDSAAGYLWRHHEGLRTSGGPSSVPVAEPVLVPRQLRHDIADFVGREALLRALDAAATDQAGRMAGGVVVVDGMAGVGKTALVKHWGHRARRHFPDGDLYVDLHGFAEDTAVTVPQSTVVDDFLIALERPPHAELNARARELLLTRLMSGRRMLIVLDNARDAGQVEHLLTLLPDALVVVTSRRRLGSRSTTTGARRVQVEPMTTAEATRLLGVRIGTRRRVTHDDQGRLAGLCGGLPLMVSLLAEHVATRPASQLPAFTAQLDRHQLVFDVGEDSGSANAQTFFEWSYHSLAEPERRLFRLLGLHPGADFSIEAAAALDGRGGDETARSVRALVGGHLLERAETLDRYRFHDLIRVFATHCAESDEETATRQAASRRLASFYLASAVNANHRLYPSRLSADALPLEDAVEPVEPADTTQAKGWFDTERNNVLAMIHRAAADGHHGHAWRLTDAAVIFYDRHGYYEDSLSVQRVAARSARAAGDQVGEASSLMGIGRVYLAIGDHTEARRHLDSALGLVERIGHEVGQVNVLSLLGKLETQRGDLSAALDLYRHSMKIAQRTDSEQGLCWTSYRMGEVLRAMDQPDRALVYLTRAQFLAERSGDQSAQASTMIEVGLVHHDRGDHASAAAHCTQALSIAEAIPDLAVTVAACVALAKINKARGATAAAIRFDQRAISRSEHGAAAHAYEVLGDVHHASGDLAGASSAWQEAEERYEQLGNPTRATVVRVKLTRLPGTGPDMGRTG